MVTFAGRRRALESLYEGNCTVTAYESVRNPITKVTSQQEVIKLENVRCRLSYKNVVASNQSEFPNGISQVIKLFTAPELAIDAGSKITVTQQGITREYNHTGVSAQYHDHQEIVLELFTGYRNYA